MCVCACVNCCWLIIYFVPQDPKVYFGEIIFFVHVLKSETYVFSPCFFFILCAHNNAAAAVVGSANQQ